MDHHITNIEEIDSPALLIYPDRVEENIRSMIAISGDASRLCPHIKTHKLPEIIRMQMAMGIGRFKCATLVEAQMLAQCGASDVVLAYQPIGPKLDRLIQLIQRFPGTKFSAIADAASIVQAASRAASSAGIVLPLLLDIDCGMGRTGILPDQSAVELYRFVAAQPGLQPGGLHVYDGHICDDDPAERMARADAAYAPVARLKEELLKAGLPVPRMIVGGTPTFAIHARRRDVECSPGTCLLWDASYGTACRDLPFLNAALVLTRVVSKPGANRLCLDLGHKAIAAERPHPRVIFPDLPDAKALKHSEEHLVVETSRANEFHIGSPLYGIPWHVCPTVALHSEAVVVRNGRAEEIWNVVRGRSPRGLQFTR